MISKIINKPVKITYVGATVVVVVEVETVELTVWLVVVDKVLVFVIVV